MAAVTRDRNARSRIREYLAMHGPIDDPSGRATAELKEAVDYQGNSVAFIQLVAAMDRDGEIIREIRGKRTYRIGNASKISAGGAAIPSEFGGGSSLGVPIDLDYDRLARALLRQVARGMEGQQDGSSYQELVVERDRLQAERDEYARRLEAARHQLGGILGEHLAGNAAEEQAS